MERLNLMSNNTFKATFLLLTGVVAGTAHAQTIYSNNANPGDLFTNTGTVNAGQAIGTTGWYYNNVRNSGEVGIRTDYDRSGNGSVFMKGVNGPTGQSSKADIEYYNTNIQGNLGSGLASMGRLGDLNALGYDWYRASGGTANAGQHASLRLMIDGDGDFTTTGDRGYLVFERAYNSTAGNVPLDQWVTEDLFSYNGGQGANLWQAPGFDTAGNWVSIATWQAGFTPSGGGKTFNADSVIYGLSSGIGSGWGTYEGAIDNITIGFAGGNATTYNFEAAPVPEPATMAVLGLGAAAVLRRRKKNS